MPLTASGQDGNKGFTRIMAGIEALILASVMFIASGIQEQKLAMTEIKTSLATSQQLMAAVPDLTIRMAQAEKDLAEHDKAIDENKLDIRDLQRATGKRPAASPRPGEIGYGAQ